jgi:predicted DNA-binding protein
MTTKAKPRAPRVNVTLSPEAYKALSELSAANDQPKAAIVAELFDAALPALKVALDAIRVVKQQPREAQRMLTAHALNARMALDQQQLLLDEAIDRRTVKGKRRRAARGPT